MEFHEKLQALRKEKGLTQEELAEQLYVSRTAVSNWESGRGFPKIDSLKAVSRLLSVSLDTLLSGEEILAIAEKDGKEKERSIGSLVFGLLDCSMVLLLFLPFFGQEIEGRIQGVSLLALDGVQPYLKAAYFALVCIMALFGVLTLAMQNCRQRIWEQGKNAMSLILSVLGMFLFMISRQPYAAAFTFVFLMIKAFMRIKRQ